MIFDLKDLSDLKEKLINQNGWIVKAKQESSMLRSLVTGEDFKRLLEHMKDCENEEQKKERDKLSKSTKHIFSELINPSYKIFSTKGTLRNYEIAKSVKSEYIDRISNVRDGYSAEKWTELYWFSKLMYDPNGLIFMEVSESEVYPTYKSIHSIYNCDQKGQNLSYVIFMPEINEEKSEERYRIIDDEKDFTLLIKKGKKDNENLYIIENVYKYRSFKSVPALVISGILNDNGYKNSPLSIIDELAKEYLRDDSVKVRYKKHHGFPLYWQLLMSKCKKCEGTGYLNGKICRDCKGSGHDLSKDVSSVLGISPPKSSDSPSIVPDVAGYVTPPTEILEQMTKEAENLKKQMTKALWGVESFKVEGDVTATEFINSLDIAYNKMTQLSEMAEKCEEFISEHIGKYHYSTFKKAIVSRSKRFILEGADKKLKEYSEAKKQGLSRLTLDAKLIDYYNAEFSNDPNRRDIMIKMIDVEPFPHLSLSEITSLKTQVSEKDLKAKMYFDAWFSELEINELNKTKIELREDLYTKSINYKLKPKENERTLQKV